MARQFENVSSRYGAPMGRHCVPDLDTTPRTVRLFRVRLDSGGYDDGGAYWGHGGVIWAAIDKDGDLQTVRAGSRLRAAFELGIPPFALRVPLDRPGEYADALLSKRAPMPAGKDVSDVLAWIGARP